jgi:D-alanyl-D-alanine carboxypeptidase
LTYGTTELGKETSPDPETHFRIASNTKTMTAAVVVLLAQEGKLRFDDPVSKYVPGVPNGDRITVSNLLKMRSGLYNYTTSSVLATSLDNDPGKVWTMDEVLTLAFSEPPNFEPDTDFEYSNTNYALLGLIAEKIDGKSLSQIFQDRLFGPLGMDNTDFPEAESADTIAEPYSHGYMYGGSSYALLDGPYPPEIISGAHDGTLQPNDVTHQNSSYAKGAGGANSTATDLMTWMRTLVDGQILNSEFQRQWLDSPQVEDPQNPAGQWYGYGIVRQEIGGNSVYYHGGELPGFNSFMGRDPVNDMTLVVWTNLPVDVDGGHQTANDIAVKILLTIYGV